MTSPTETWKNPSSPGDYRNVDVVDAGHQTLAPCPVVPDLVVPCLVVPCLAVPGLVAPGLVVPCLVVPSLVGPSLVGPGPLATGEAASCQKDQASWDQKDPSNDQVAALESDHAYHTYHPVEGKRKGP